MKIAKIFTLGMSCLVVPCVAIAVVAPSGEMLEQIDTASLGDGWAAVSQPADVAPKPRWTIQVGAFSNQDAANAQLDRISDLDAAVLSSASRLVTPMSRNSGRVLYRARFGNLDQNAAQEVCAVLNHRGESCFVSAEEISAPALRDALDMPAKPEALAMDLAIAAPVSEEDLQNMRAGFRAAGAKAAAPAARVKLALITSAEQVSNSELQDARGGFFTAGGAQFDFGASVQTMVNGQLALQSSVNWTAAGAVTQQLAGLGASIQNQVSTDLAKAGIGTVATPTGSTAAAASALGSTAPATASAPTVQTAAVPTTVMPITNTSPQVPGLSGVQIQSPTGGSTQVLANLGGNAIQNIVSTSASNQNIVQNTNVTLTIYNFPAWQQQIAQNAVSSQLAHEIMSAAGLGSGH